MSVKQDGSGPTVATLLGTCSTDIPREFEAQGYAPGSSVLVEELPGGDLRITSTEKVSELIRDIGERVVAEHGEALQILTD